MSKEPPWSEVASLLNDALELPPEERSDFLDGACGKDGALRQRIEALLAVEERVGDFLQRPIFSLQSLPANPEESGERIGSYQLGHRLGEGGMGTVYLAERVEGGFVQQVAIKILKRGMDTEEIIRRFEDERQILAGLNHPHVARLLDGGTTAEGLPFFVLERVIGEPIDTFCERRGLSLPDRLRLFLKVCDAVQFAHRNLVIHRDLKPSNILVTEEGEPKLLDFGIAKLVGRQSQHQTLPGQPSPMTPYYAAPEQIEGGVITTATDTYALGILLYVLLTGQRPYGSEGQTEQQIHRAVCEEVPRRPSAVQEGPFRRRLAGDLDTVVLTALRKEPERRFSSVESLAEDLQRHLDGLPIRSRPDTWTYRTGKFFRRHPWATAASMLILLLALGLATLGYLTTARNTRIERLGEQLAREKGLSESVTQFLTSFLESADSSRTQGQTLTVQEAFAVAAQRLETDLEEAPEIRATLLDAVGGVYRDLEFYTEARPFLEQALVLRRSSLGDQHPLVAESLHNLANLELRVKDLGKAEERMRQAIAIQRKAFPQGHRDFARGLNNLASLLRRQDKFDQAEGFAREALAMRLRLFGPQNLEVAYTLNTLGTIRLDQGQLAEAEDFYLQALEIRRKEEPESVEVSNSLLNLAELHLRANRSQEALPFAERCLALRHRLYPEGHSRVVNALNLMSRVHTALGDEELALRYEAEEKALKEQLARP